jgi:hypothetical protein
MDDVSRLPEPIRDEEFSSAILLQQLQGKGTINRATEDPPHNYEGSKCPQSAAISHTGWTHYPSRHL